MNISLATSQVISDGVSLMMLFCNHLCDPGPSLKLKPRFGGSSFPLNVCRALVVGPLTFLISWLLLTKRDFNYLKRGSKPPGRQRVIAWTAGNIRLSQVYRIKQITRSTFNDVLMTAMSGSLRSFFKRRGVVNPPDIKECVAVGYASRFFLYVLKGGANKENQMYALPGKCVRGILGSLRR
ncbi:hypothetical protein MTO96_046967 [Rhipicephalus appendiculatus]